MKRRDLFTTIRTEGGVLPTDLLQRIAAGDRELDGLSAESYHLAKGERLNEIASRSWNRLLGAWRTFRDAVAALPEGDPATSPTRERWLLILFQELGYGRLQTSRAVEVDGKSYAISHSWGHSPIHLVGCGVDIDKKAPGVAGATRASPHGLVQELLSRSEEHLWGFVSNGLTLRILRDNVSLTRQAYVEFDLEAMMEGEVYSDFAVLWRMCHESRVEAEKPEECWLERWSRDAQERGTRARDHLRDGVEKAIRALGAGFLAHPANKELRAKLREGGLAGQDYYRQLLRLVYRLIFLFVAEDRELLLDPDGDETAKERYRQFYSTSRFRRLAEAFRGTRHVDLYRCFDVVMSKLGGIEGCPELALPALGSFLWSREAVADIIRCDVHNREFLAAIRALAFIVDEKVFRAIDYKNLGSEELGSVYESLLELHPELNTEAATFELRTAGGHERKTTGSYYTPTSLITCLLDSALDPVLNEAAKKRDAEAAILALKVCDPACGSGHFLVAAAHRMAKRLAAVRTGEDEPSPEAIHHALRDVIGRCIYGVDLNPMAVELCKVSFWMEAIEPGKPLSFLDHHVKCGNSFLGTTPALIGKGIPDDAFKPIEGDENSVCSAYKKQNREEREGGQRSLFHAKDSLGLKLGNLAASMARIEGASDDTVEGVRSRQDIYQSVVSSSDYIFGRLLADAWCAAFVWTKTRDTDLPYALTQGALWRIEESPHSVPGWLKDEVKRLAKQYRFFHWHIEFPDVFRPAREHEIASNGEAGWSGGFDVVLGNPPWERIKLQEKEWFATRSPEIAESPNAAARKRQIKRLKEEDPDLYAHFREDKRRAEAASHLVRDSGRYPLCGRGDVNTYAIFGELKRSLIAPPGRVGCIVPSGIATDDTTKFFFQDLMERRLLVSLYDFENRNGIFPSVHRSYKFCLLTMTGTARPAEGGSEFVFFAFQAECLRDPERRITLSAEDIALLNPNTRTCPVFRTKRDAELTLSAYRRMPAFKAGGETCWPLKLGTLFHSSGDADKFEDAVQLQDSGWTVDSSGVPRKASMKAVPLYEGKMFSIFDHRSATVVLSHKALVRQRQSRETTPEEHLDPSFRVLPFFWVRDANIDPEHRWRWIVCYKKVTSPTNERTLIATILPECAANDSIHLLLPEEELSGADGAVLTASLGSFAVDYVGRQKLGGVNFNFFVFEQLPIHAPNTYVTPCPWEGRHQLRDWIAERVLELTYTSWDLEPFAQDCRHDGPPFRWDEERRFLLRAELDAAFFHLYGIEHDDADYVMETFPIVKRKDEAKYDGDYRTKRVILEVYDKMREAMRSGKSYKTLLDPPPADPRVAHSPDTRPEWIEPGQEMRGLNGKGGT